MKWRHQGAWRGGAGGWKQRGGEARSRRRGGEWGGIRRIALRLCSIKGEITHLLRFFLKTTALIDQTAWMYRPIFNMKYRHQKSITPVFPLPSPRGCVRLGVAGSSSLRRRLMHLHQRLPPPCAVSTRGVSRPLRVAMDLRPSPSDTHIMLSAGTCAWQMEKSIIFNNYLTFPPPHRSPLLYFCCFPPKAVIIIRDFFSPLLFLKHKNRL